MIRSDCLILIKNTSLLLIHGGTDWPEISWQPILEAVTSICIGSVREFDHCRPSVSHSSRQVGSCNVSLSFPCLPKSFPPSLISTVGKLGFCTRILPTEPTCCEMPTKQFVIKSFECLIIFITTIFTGKVKNKIMQHITRRRYS